ncbi:MAG TPA: deaminase [Candidatus Nanoarchaeia archaeon]|nr:deaminase [Candidatus Nanoarchaeia archaeon]
MIIGVTGMYCSGKDTVAEMLQKQKFIHYSLSDEIRFEMQTRKIKITRDSMINFANKLREEEGPDVFAKKVLAKLKDEKNYVLTSIRHPDELKVLQQNKEFVFLNVTAPEEIRLQRIIARNRDEGDPKTIEELRSREKQESSEDKNKQQLHKVIKKADIVLNNEGSLKDLQNKIYTLLHDLRKKFAKPRPSWDEYFINITREIARRATCLRGKIGVVVVKDKRIIATGYNGSAKGLPHCDEEGCMRWKTIDENGQEEERCLRTVHGEANAIAQAALHGVSTEGSTLYGTYKPCSVCMKLIINAGIKEVICEKNYHDPLTDIFAKQAGIKLRILKPLQEAIETVL